MTPGPASGGIITADLAVGYMKELHPLMTLHDQTEDGPRTSAPETVTLPELYHVPALDGEPTLAGTLELASTALALFGPDVVEAADGEEEVRENLDHHHEVLRELQAMIRDDDVRVVVVPAREVFRE